MSKVTICIPAALRVFTEGVAEVSVSAADVGDALRTLGRRHEGLLNRIVTPGGRLRPMVNVYIDRDNVKTLDGLATPLRDGAVVVIVPAVAGG